MRYVLPICLLAISLALTACSKEPQTEPIVVETKQIQYADPTPPPPLKLEDPEFFYCENDTMLCLKPEDYRAIVRNNKKIGRWIVVAKSNLKYYRDMNKAAVSKN